MGTTQSNPVYDYEFKVVLIGDTCVGKTCILSRFMRNEFSFTTEFTLGADFSIKYIQIEGKNLKIQFWDTGSPERGRSLIEMYCKGATGALLVYDITRRYTFTKLKGYLKNLQKDAGQNTAKILVGNKSDLEHEREVPINEARDFAVKNNLMFFETSAKDASNVEAAFLQVLTGCRSSMIEGPLTPIGKLLNESFDVEVIVWRIPYVNSIPKERGDRVQTPPFSFAGATWILKMILFGQKKYKSEGQVDIEIERLYSEIPKHLVSFEIFLTSSEMSEQIFKDNYLQGRNWNSKYQTNYNHSFSFDSTYNKGIITNVYSTKEFFDLASNGSSPGTVLLFCVLRMKKNHAAKWHSQVQLLSDVDGQSECFFCKVMLETSNVSSREESTIDEAIKCPTCNEVLKENFFKHQCMTARVKGRKQLLDDMKRIMLCGDHSDTTIRVKEEDFRLHKSILRARNPFFDSMFKTGAKDADPEVISIDNCDPDQFCSLIHYIYTGTVDKLSPETVCGIYEVAELYQEKQLKAECLLFMLSTISVENFCDYMELALRHDEKDLFQRVSSFFVFKTKEIPSSEKWKEFVKKHPEQVDELYLKVLNLEENKNCLSNRN